MKRFVKQSFEFCALQCRLLNPAVASRIHAAHGSARDFGRGGNGISLLDTGLTVDAANAPFLGQAGAEMRALSKSLGVRWKPIADSKFEAQIGDVAIEVSSFEDVFVVSEVFGLGVYALSHPTPSVVIDIGGNIGASALYFASKPWVEKVFSFEPLKPTAQVARANYARNPKLAAKITLFEYGLSAKDETMSVEYSPEWKGKSGPQSLPSELPRTKSWKEEIQLRNAAQVLPPIFDSASGKSIVVKMDCEGGEWSILPELAKTGLLRRIDHISMEWHDRTPEPLEKLLVENGFNVLRRMDHLDAKIGLIHATQVAHKNGASNA